LILFCRSFRQQVVSFRTCGVTVGKRDFSLGPGPSSTKVSAQIAGLRDI
jgi:hypothetical protein